MYQPEDEQPKFDSIINSSLKTIHQKLTELECTQDSVENWLKSSSSDFTDDHLILLADELN